ncbi:uncharacterized protein Dana_GF27627 [Drosophila ananassae]|uniref:Uncharacterized protein n=1 Tax=Drosophila ananassae TaxID=7217 RepID=A0A0P9AEW6_DROAN|nr:uncharacterized protein Dana_GF27627 [Drosophila ananassae]
MDGWTDGWMDGWMDGGHTLNTNEYQLPKQTVGVTQKALRQWPKRIKAGMPSPIALFDLVVKVLPGQLGVVLVESPRFC